MMTTETILDAAVAGFSTYYHNRPYYTWATCEDANRIMWEQIAEQVLDGTFTRAAEAHDYYMQLHAYPVPWSDISTRTRDRWVQAWWAMIRVRDTAKVAA